MRDDSDTVLNCISKPIFSPKEICLSRVFWNFLHSFGVYYGLVPVFPQTGTRKTACPSRRSEQNKLRDPLEVTTMPQSDMCNYCGILISALDNIKEPLQHSESDEAPHPQNSFDAKILGNRPSQ